MTQNRIETFKTSIYNPKHTNNIKNHDNFSEFSIFLKSIFSKKISSNKSAFHADLYSIIYITEGHTA